MGPSNVTIRRAERDQAGELADMWVALAAGQREYRSHIHAEDNRAQIRQRVLHYITDDRLLIAQMKDLCGFVMFSLERGSFEQDTTRGFVENLYVRPVDRDEGIGTALLEASEHALRGRGAESIALNVMAENEDARRFYRRQDYHPHRVELEKELGRE